MLPRMPEAGRESANVILDAVSAFDVDRHDNSAAMDLAVQRLNDIDGAYRVLVNERDEVTLDLSNLVGGSTVTIMRLVQLLAEATGVSREEVISDLREWLG